MSAALGVVIGEAIMFAGFLWHDSRREQPAWMTEGEAGE